MSEWLSPYVPIPSSSDLPWGGLQAAQDLCAMKELCFSCLILSLLKQEKRDEREHRADAIGQTTSG